MLRELGYHDAASMRAHYADGIHRALQVVEPRVSQPYQTMQLMQFNFFMESGLIAVDRESGLLDINYERYHDVVTAMLQEVLRLQNSGSYPKALQFVTRWSYWNEELHDALAERMLESNSYRRTMVRYKALDH
jgi:hypothetical protein